MEKTQEKPSEIVNFDPNKSYKWNNNDIFYMTGQEFGAILNTIRGIGATEVAQVFRLIDKSVPLVNSILAKAVENGIAQEIPPESSEQNPEVK